MQASSTGSSITARGDSRVTAVGRVLRETKIDELPQLWNVFRGEMNFLGPRPEVAEFVDLADPLWRSVLSVTPGIADLATLVFLHEEHLLSGQNNAEKFYREWLLPRKLELSLHYARTRSTATDAKLIALTLTHLSYRREFDRTELARQFAYKGALCHKLV